MKSDYSQFNPARLTLLRPRAGAAREGVEAVLIRRSTALRRTGGYHFLANLRAVALLTGLLTLAVEATSARAQSVTNAPAPAELMAQLQTRLSEAQAELGGVLAAQGGGTNLPPGATASEATEYRIILQSRVRAYEEHLAGLADWDAARQRRRDLDQAITSWAGFAGPPPYSIALVDELWDSVQSLTAGVKADETTRDILQSFAGEAQADLNESDGELRRFNELSEASRDRVESVRLAWQQTLARARNRLAAAKAAAIETRQHRLDLELAGHRQHLAFVQRQLAVAAQQVRFSQTDLDQVVADLDDRRRLLDEEYRAGEAESAAREQALAAARESFRRALAARAEPSTNAVAQTAEVRRLEELVQVRSAQSETSALRLRVLGRLEDFVLGERGLWQMRFATFHTDDLAKLQEAYRRLDRLRRLVQVGKPYFSQQVELAASQLAEQQNRLRNQAAPSAGLAMSRELLEAYQQREELFRRGLRHLEHTERLILRWKESFDQDRRSLPLAGRVRDLFTQVSTFGSKLWTFELFALEDTITVDGQPVTGRRSVTIGKVVMALLILAAGFFVARLASRWVERFAATRLKVEPNQANLIRRWLTLVLVIGLIVFSLISVKIPLTVFAFAGGALAIGLGFGTQNLLKNFISGIIILFERPFRVGDVLDIEGRRGLVTGIGLRSSVLRLWDGTETLIPNSALLENNLTNWTYSNHAVRFSLSIGAAYGSDTRQVGQLLADAAGRHGLVLKAPQPQVLFQDFGDNALIFELRYWVNVRQHNAAQIGSDLRHMIASAFAEHGIGIPFPQRDVHLDAALPLRVQVVSPPVASLTLNSERP